MTNLEAIQVEVKPYEADALDCEKALMGACKRTGTEVTLTSNYSAENERVIALAAVLVLYKFVTLNREEEGEWGKTFNDKLEKRIKALCNANNLDASEFVGSDLITMSNGSNMF